jgi:hypothetical protein
MLNHVKEKTPLYIVDTSNESVKEIGERVRAFVPKIYQHYGTNKGFLQFAHEFSINPKSGNLEFDGISMPENIK